MENRHERVIDLEAEFARYVRAGDVEALGRVFDATAPGLLSVARHLTRGASECEDLVQQTFVTAIERATSFDASRNLLPWLTGILALHARKNASAVMRTPDPERLVVRDGEDPHDAARGAEVASAVESALVALPERYASVLRLHLREQLAPREIARRVGVEPGTVRVQLHRGLQMLRDALPAGIGGYAVAPLATTGGLAGVRESVLAHGSLTAAARVPAAAVATTGAWFAQPLLWIAAALVLVVGGYGALGGFGGAAHDDEHAAIVLPAAVATAATEPLADPAPTTIAPARVEAATTAVAATNVANASADATVLGRLLLPNGRPAAYADVRLVGWTANAERVSEAVPPSAWRSPAAVRTDADGRFAISFAPPRAFQFSLDAEFAGHVAMSWRWSELADGSRTDVGERAFEPACTIHVRVVDRDGTPLPAPFTVVWGRRSGAFARDDATAAVSVEGRYDEARGVYVLDGVGPGRGEVHAGCDTSVKSELTYVEARTDETVAIDFVYAGPDPRTRIVVLPTASPFTSTSVDLERVTLRRGSDEVPRSKGRNSRSPSVAFDDLAPGEYTVEIDDPRFEKYVKTGVAPGTLVRAKLVGNAALRVVLRDDGQRVEKAPRALTLVQLGTRSSPNETNLLQPDRLPVVDGFVTGILPGRCELRVAVDGYAESRVSLGDLARGERREVTVDLQRARTLRGVVLEAKDGPPSSGVVVLLTPGASSGHGLGRSAMVSDRGVAVPAARSRTTTSADGRFAFDGLERGTYTLRAVWNEWLHVDRTIEIGADAVPELALSAPESGAIDVETRFSERASPDEVGLSIRRVDVRETRAFVEHAHGRVALDADGKASIERLPVGRYAVGLALAIGETWSAGHEEIQVDVVAGRRFAAVLDVRGKQPARLRLRTKLEGTTRADQSFELRDVNGGVVRAHSSFDPDAGESVSHVPPGSYRLVYSGLEQSWTWTDPRVIELAPGRRVDLDVDVPILERTLLVRDAADRPLADRDVRVTAIDSPDAKLATRRTDASGRVRFGLLAGRYRFEVDGAASAPLDWSKDLADRSVLVIGAR